MIEVQGIVIGVGIGGNRGARLPLALVSKLMEGGGVWQCQDGKWCWQWRAAAGANGEVVAVAVCNVAAAMVGFGLGVGFRFSLIFGFRHRCLAYL